MSTTQQNKTPSRSHQPDPDTQRADNELPDDRDTAEETVHTSRTAQDRDHYIRRGDDSTDVTKVFPG